MLARSLQIVGLSSVYSVESEMSEARKKESRSLADVNARAGCVGWRMLKNELLTLCTYNNAHLVTETFLRQSSQ